MVLPQPGEPATILNENSGRPRHSTIQGLSTWKFKFGTLGRNFLIVIEAFTVTGAAIKA